MKKQTNLILGALWLLLCLDVILLILHVVWGTTHPLFYLDTEQNIPTAYQALKAIGLSGLFGWMAYKQRHMLYAFLSVSLLILGIDEWFFFHENIESYFRLLAPDWIERWVLGLRAGGYHSSSWIVFLFPLMLVWLGVIVYMVRQASLWQRKVLGVSAGLYGLVLILELIGTRGKLDHQAYFWAATVEEFAEMVGISILILMLNQGLISQLFPGLNKFRSFSKK